MPKAIYNMSFTLSMRTDRLIRERDSDLDQEGEFALSGRDASLEVVLEVSVGVAIVGSALAIGAVHVPVMAAVAGVATVALATAIRLGSRVRGTPTLLFWGLALYSAFQALPLPIGVLRAIAPANADVWTRAMVPFGAEVSAASISLDPGASLIEAMRWYTYGAVFLAAGTVATRRGRAVGLSWVFIAALAAAIATVGHGLLGATKVFGLYQPAFRPLPWHLGPLLNPNNLSGYLNLGAFCGLGLLAGHKTSAPRWMTAAGIVILFGVNATTGSRGGVALLILGLVALTIALAVTGRGRAGGAEAWRRVGIVSLGALGLGIALAVLGGGRRMWAELYDQSLAKLEMLRWVKPVALDHWTFGIGRGSFESVFPAYQSSDGRVVYTHAENFVAQWFTEWGAVVTIAVILAAIWFFRPGKLQLGASGLATAAWVGVVVLVLQNLADLGFEIPAVCVAGVAVLGTLWGAARRDKPQPRRSRRRRVFAWVTVAVGFALIGGTAWGGWRTLARDRQNLQTAALTESSPREPGRLATLRNDLRHAMRRHPAEPYFPLLGATLAWQEGDESPIPWLQYALERSRVNGRAHLLLAHTLAQRGPRMQALLELRLAVESEPSLSEAAALLGARIATTTEELRSMAPEGAPGAAMFDALGQQLSAPERRALGAYCDEAAIARNPALAAPHKRLGNDVILRALAGKCVEPGQCEQDLEVHAVALAKIEPDASSPAQLRARLLMARDKPEEAEALLRAACDGTTDVRACVSLRAAAAAKTTEPLLAAASKSLLAASCMRGDTCAEAATIIGDLHASRGEWGAAVSSYERATREAPSDERWLKLADAASRAGLHSQAAQIYERVLRRRDDAELRGKLARERDQTMPGH